MDVPVLADQLFVDIACSLEDLPGTVDDRDEWQEIVRETRAISFLLHIKWLASEISNPIHVHR